MVKEFNSLEEIQKYYDKDTNTYVFEENGSYIDLVVLNFYLSIDANIEAFNIKALDITANDINVNDINALDINASDITARNIKARNISAEDIWGRDIYARDITAQNIKADDISYYALCVAYNNIKCKTNLCVDNN